MRINAQDDESGMACLIGDWISLIVSDGLLNVGLVTQIDVSVAVSVVVVVMATAVTPSVMMCERCTFNHWCRSVVCATMMTTADISEV